MTFLVEVLISFYLAFRPDSCGGGGGATIIHFMFGWLSHMCVFLG